MKIVFRKMGVTPFLHSQRGTNVWIVAIGTLASGTLKNSLRNNSSHSYAKYNFTVAGIQLNLPTISTPFTTKYLSRKNFLNFQSFDRFTPFFQDLFLLNEKALCKVLTVSRVFFQSKIAGSKFVKKYILSLAFSPLFSTISSRQLEKVLKYAMERSNLLLAHSKDEFLQIVDMVGTWKWPQKSRVVAFIIESCSLHFLLFSRKVGKNKKWN